MLEYFNLGQGLDTYTSPMQGKDGQMIHGVNVQTFPLGAISKRPGYSTFLGTADGSQVNSLLAFPRQDGTTLWLYRASGSQLLYSQQGTGAWTICAGSTGGDSGGTITAGSHVSGAILNDNFIVCDGAGSTRNTTTGTTFANTSNAPVAVYLQSYQQRIYAAGTAGTVVYSSAGSADNWSPSAPADSSSFLVPGEGKPSGFTTAADHLIIEKNRGNLFQWDQSVLLDMSTKYGPSSPYSVGAIEDKRFWINQYGITMFDGATNTLISNPIQRYFYNRNNTGIAGGSFPTIPGECHIYNYLAAVGTVTDDFTGRQINNAIINYDFQKNTFVAWQFNDNPTAFLSYFDNNNLRQLIFGNNSGQCFKLDPTKTSDNGNPIATDMVFLFSYAAQQESFTSTSASQISGMSYEKKWNWIRIFLNPGCEINMQYAFANTFTYQHLKWSEGIQITAPSDGIFEYRFPLDQNNVPRSRLLFVRLYESSDNSAWTCYGMSLDAEIQIIK